MDRGTRGATVHRVAKSRTRLSTHIHTQARGQNSGLWTLSPMFCCLLLTSLVSYMKYKGFGKTVLSCSVVSNFLQLHGL